MKYLMKSLRQLLLTALALSTILALGNRAAHAVGEQVGRIKGVVTDAGSGVPLPAMTITARSPSLIGGARTVMSDEQGRYEIISLPPGLYTVEFSYAGATPATRQITVVQGATAPLNLAWTIESAGVEKVAITETRNLTSPDSGQTGSVLGGKMLGRIPTGRSYQTVTQMAPGVSGRTNVTGGNNPNIRGGTYIHNRYLIDGLDVTDPITGTFSANLNFESIGSLQILTGGMEAQYNSLGGVVNVISQGGSNEWQANASLYVNHQKLSATGSYGSTAYSGVQPFNDTEVGPNTRTAFALNVGGPILRDRLWFNANYELTLREISPIKGPPFGAPPYDIQHPPESVQVHLLRAKVGFAPTQAHRFTLTGNMDPAFFNNTSPTQPNRLLGVAEDRQNQGGFFVIGHWDWFINQPLHFNLQAGYQVNTIEYGPQGRLGDIDTAGCDHPDFKRMDNCTWLPDRARHVNIVDQTVWYQGNAYGKDRRETIQADPSLTLRGRLLGTHDAKAGVQMRINRRKEVSITPGGSVYYDNGGRLEAGLCDPTSADGKGCFRREDYPDYEVKERGYSIGFYIQDRWWTPLTWLTVVPGFRVDYGHTENREGVTVSNLLGFGPRLALVADVTGDGQTVVSATYGRANEVLSLLPAANYDSREASVTIQRQWDPINKTFDRDDAIIGRSGGKGGVQIGDDLKTPHTDEITVSARRQVFNNTVFGANYTWKKISNQWDWAEINQIWDPSGQRVVDWADGDRVNKRAIYEFRTPDENYRKYHGFDLVAEGNPTDNWYFNTSYTLAWLYGPGITSFDQIDSYGQLYNPRTYRYYDGFLPEDVRHTLKTFGAYQAGPINIGLNLRYETGPPRTKLSYSAKEGDFVRYRSPLGTDPGGGNDVEQISENRLPDHFQADLRVTGQLLPQRFGHQLTLIVDIFNVLGTRRPTTIVTEDIEEFGQVAARQQPLRVQLGLNYSF